MFAFIYLCIQADNDKLHVFQLVLSHVRKII